MYPTLTINISEQIVIRWQSFWERLVHSCILVVHHELYRTRRMGKLLSTLHAGKRRDRCKNQNTRKPSDEGSVRFIDAWQESTVVPKLNGRSFRMSRHVPEQPFLTFVQLTVPSCSCSFGML
ncbi:hypothetical protein IscW_ISCW018320 [Ixodes scapularis]|uniref:Uncharacterized protein n=1 Tax=Ixodes scapularis TaxID=6945 RepID=B7PGU9_IXOSC|nr:hypothetical protein IscW_ISCW018320 [Ixodes scapularis]|eukprot:XP_002401458.1 hypothetical protein IscW_ISCW018320 [Ixodes scapularis]